MADKKVDAITGEVKEQLWGDGVEKPKIPEDKKLQYFDRFGETLDEEECVKANIIHCKPVHNYQEECVKVYKIHCKPVYNYQSVEFDWEIHFDTQDSDFVAMRAFYSKMLEMLVAVSGNAPQKDVSKPVAPVEEPASERQKQILRDFHIDFKPDITKKQAHALIKKSMDQEIF